MTNREFHHKALYLRLYPTKDQELLLSKTVGCCRYVYNRYLDQKIRYYKRHGKSLSNGRCSRRLTILKQKEDHQWLKEVNAQALQQSLIDLDSAYKNFFRGAGFPKFHRKGQKESFRLPQECGYDTENKELKLPKYGSIKARGDWKSIPKGKLQSITVRKDNNKWYSSCLFKIEGKPKLLPSAVHPICGIDVGVKRPIQTYQIMNTGEEKYFLYGTKIKKKLELLEIRRKRYQRKMARCSLKSNNWNKARRKVESVYWKERQTRKNFSNQLTAKLSSKFQTVVVEDLRIKAITSKVKKNSDGSPRKNVSAKSGLNRELLRLGLGSFVSLLEYKLGKRRKGNLIKVDPHFTSSTCGACGHQDKASRTSQSKFHCVKCGHKQNADKNAARNILQKALAA